MIHNAETVRERTYYEATCWCGWTSFECLTRETASARATRHENAAHPESALGLIDGQDAPVSDAGTMEP